MATALEQQTWGFTPYASSVARQWGVAQLLLPIAEMTQELFPELRQLNVDVQTDMDVADLSWLDYGVLLPRGAESDKAPDWDRWVTELADRQHEWSARLLKICSPAQALHFTIHLDFVD